MEASALREANKEIMSSLKYLIEAVEHLGFGPAGDGYSKLISATNNAKTIYFKYDPTPPAKVVTLDSKKDTN